MKKDTVNGFCILIVDTFVVESMSYRVPQRKYNIVMRIYILAQVDVLLCDALPLTTSYVQERRTTRLMLHDFCTYSCQTPYFEGVKFPPVVAS